MNLETKVLELIKEPIMALGYTKVYVNYVREQGNNVLRVTIDKDDVVSLDDIIAVNDIVSPILDEADLIAGEYLLDVTSLGAEKPIEIDQLDKYLNRYVNIHLSHPYKGANILEGDLSYVDNDKVIISYRDKTCLIKAEVERKHIDKARLAIKF